MSRRSTLLAVLALGALSLAGCDKASGGGAAESGSVTSPTAAASTTSASPSESATESASESASPSDAASASAGTEAAGTLPAICPLLSKAEVTALTGEQVSLMTDDGGSNASRYCQWQLSQGQVTVAVNRETREGFDIRNKQAVPVPGVGTTAYFLSGHLFVWENGRDVDVYVSSESSEAANLDVAKRTATQFLPRLAAADK